MNVLFQIGSDSVQIQRALNEGRLLLVYGRGTPAQAHSQFESLASRFLGRAVTYSELPKNFRGKPYLKDFPLHFNISHAQDAFLLGFSMDHEIGVDMELDPIDGDLNALSEYAFSPDERKMLVDLNDRESFLNIWTLKEAYLKATGIGLIDALPSLHVVSAPNFGMMDNLYSCQHFKCPGGETGSLVCKSSLNESVLGFFLK